MLQWILKQSRKSCREKICLCTCPKCAINSNVNLNGLLFLDQGKIPMAMITTMKKLKSGYINGTRVTLGNLGDFLSTSAITNLSFLGSQEDGYPDSKYPIYYLNTYFVFNKALPFHTTSPKICIKNMEQTKYYGFSSFDKLMMEIMLQAKNSCNPNRKDV